MSRGAFSRSARASYFFAPDPPRDAAAARDLDDEDLRNLIRLHLANRGVWESGWWLGPTVSTQHVASDVDLYLSGMRRFLEDALT